MASINIQQPSDSRHFQIIDPAQAYESSITPTQIDCYSDATHENYTSLTGDFLLSDGAVVGGTIHGLTVFAAGQALYTIDGINAGMASYLAYARMGDARGFLHELLSSGDQILDSPGSDFIETFGGDDQFWGGDGSDTLVGGAGNDIYLVDAGDTIIEYAHEGVDWVFSMDSWTLGAHIDSLGLGSDANAAGTGNRLHNVIIGNLGANALAGLDGNDLLKGGAGEDTLRGGGGTDTLVGQAGADDLRGGRGTDTLVGQAGADTLSGGDGADRFKFVKRAQGPDTITDFSAAEGDKLVFVSPNFGDLPLGVLAEGRFCVNPSGTAEEADDRFIYATDTRVLWFDADGSGSAPPVQIARLSVASLAASDIQVAVS